MVERFHRTLKNALKCRKEDWLIALPSVLLALRCLPNENGICPFTAVTGTTPLTPHSFFSSHTHSPLKQSEAVQRLAECMSDIDFCSLSQGIHHTQKQLLRSSALHKGDFVFVRIDRVRKPLESPYEGPYEVIDYADKIVKIKLPNDTLSVISVDRIKLAKLRKSVGNSIQHSVAGTASHMSSDCSEAHEEQLEKPKVPQKDTVRHVTFAL